MGDRVVLDLYFALSSESGTWTLDEMRTWQSAADLVPRKPIRLRFAREFGLRSLTEPRRGLG